MKQFILSFASGFFLLFNGIAQTIPNSSFENWSIHTYYEDPVGYMTTNLQSYFTMGVANVTRSIDAHSGYYAARLETVASGPNVIQGALIIGNPSTGYLSGGLPYTEHPYNISLWAKYNSMPGDSCIIVFSFSLMGAPVGFSYWSLTGQQSNYQQITIPVMWGDSTTMPDSLGIAIFSSSPGGITGVGSYLYIDDIYFDGVTSQLPNAGLENWMPIASEEPVSWTTSNLFTIAGGGISVSSSTDHYDGSYSIKLVNKTTGGNGDTTSFITNGYIGSNGPAGGTPVPGNPAKFSFWYKYSPVGPDSALAGGWLYKHSTSPDTTILLEQVMHRLPPASTWTLHEIPFTYNSWPPADTINIAFAGGNVDGNNYSGIGSTLYVDKIQLFMQPVGLNEVEASTDQSSVIPNPAVNNIVINPGKGMKDISVEILDMNGKMLKSFSPLSGGNANIDISGLPSGIYLYRIISGSSIQNGRFIKL